MYLMSRLLQFLLGSLFLVVIVLSASGELEPASQIEPVVSPAIFLVDSEPMEDVVSEVTDSSEAPADTADIPLSSIQTDVAGGEVTTLYRVTTVIDGDTIEVDYFGTLRRVRYIGVDTPETVHPSRPVECFGREAAARNRELVADQWVRLERDISDTDKYGRLLRYVYVDNVMVNETLVADGFANVSTYPPDVRHVEEFRSAEATARTERRGLWGAGCEAVSDTPISAVPNELSEGQCLIKGNISQSSGERIYHVPGCEYYPQTVITSAVGERWFCTEAEALAAGWRKAGNCP